MKFRLKRWDGVCFMSISKLCYVKNYYSSLLFALCVPHLYFLTSERTERLYLQ